jgi:hypothetical protein
MKRAKFKFFEERMINIKSIRDYLNSCCTIFVLNKGEFIKKWIDILNRIFKVEKKPPNLVQKFGHRYVSKVFC